MILRINGKGRLFYQSPSKDSPARGFSSASPRRAYDCITCVYIYMSYIYIYIYIYIYNTHIHTIMQVSTFQCKLLFSCDRHVHTTGNTFLEIPVDFVFGVGLGSLQVAWLYEPCCIKIVHCSSAFWASVESWHQNDPSCWSSAARSHMWLQHHQISLTKRNNKLKLFVMFVYIKKLLYHVHCCYEYLLLPHHQLSLRIGEREVGDRVTRAGCGLDCIYIYIYIYTYK